jgi:hypothetical protein
LRSNRTARSISGCAGHQRPCSGRASDMVPLAAKSRQPVEPSSDASDCEHTGILS